MTLWLGFVIKNIKNVCVIMPLKNYLKIT